MWNAIHDSLSAANDFVNRLMFILERSLCRLHYYYPTQIQPPEQKVVFQMKAIEYATYW